MGTSFASDINAMASLLGGADPDDVEEDAGSYARRTAAMTPGTLAGSAGSMRDDGVAIPKAKGARERGDPKAIWALHELMDDFDDDEDGEEGGDGLVVPAYEFLYKQAVSTADAFLGMSHNKDPGSRSCEDVVCKIQLPGTKALRELDLNVEADRLQLRSHVYKLNVYLPHRVDSERGKAEWDQKTECLKVTLPIVEDEDGYYY